MNRRYSRAMLIQAFGTDAALGAIVCVAVFNVALTGVLLVLTRSEMLARG